MACVIAIIVTLHRSIDCPSLVLHAVDVQCLCAHSEFRESQTSFGSAFSVIDYRNRSTISFVDRILCLLQSYAIVQIRFSCLQVDSVEEIQAALQDPMGFLERLAKSMGPAAKKLALARLRPKLEPALKKQGLQWSDATPLLKEARRGVERLIVRVGTRSTDF